MLEKEIYAMIADNARLRVEVERLKSDNLRLTGDLYNATKAGTPYWIERDTMNALINEAEHLRAGISVDDANELQDILRTLTNSGTAIKTSARELVAAFTNSQAKIDSLEKDREKLIRMHKIWIESTNLATKHLKMAANELANCNPEADFTFQTVEYASEVERLRIALQYAIKDMEICEASEGTEWHTEAKGKARAALESGLVSK